MTANRDWNLESFIDSLVVELDRARETLAVKAVNRPLTYSVKDVALDLQLFPKFDGKQVTFVTAEPGQNGASKVSIQLGSITDQQIRATSRAPISKDDTLLEDIDDIDEETKINLNNVGVRSVNDLEKIEDKNIDIQKIGNKKVNYTKLAQLVKKARRGKQPPSISKVSIASSENGNKVLRIDGQNLSIAKDFEPVAVIDDRLANVVFASAQKLEIELDQKGAHNFDLVMTLDPYALFKIRVDHE